MTITSQRESELAIRPATVSSTSSIDTNASPHDTSGNEGAEIQTDIIASAPEPVTSAGQAPRPADLSVSHDGLYEASPTLTNTSSDRVPSSVSLVARPNNLHITPSGGVSAGVVVPAMPTTNTVPEFLYQLTKMLTDNNREIIEWSNGKIEVHSPHKLEEQVLNRYFRHSKFASFQRQLNYFGFRKQAGKGKMAPCSYINEATTQELGSLLLIKRKTGNEPKAKGIKKRDREDPQQSPPAIQSKATDASSVNPVLAGILYRSSSDQQISTSAQTPGTETQALSSSVTIQPQSQQQIAQVAVGRGIRHGYTVPPALSHSSTPNPLAPKTPVEASLSALTSNYHSSLQNLSRLDAEVGAQGQRILSDSIHDYVPGTLSRDDSLVDLAMIPLLDESEPVQPVPQGSNGLTFVDFPWLESSVTKAPDS